jgi:deoxycytidylate deaminase
MMLTLAHGLWKNLVCERNLHAGADALLYAARESTPLRAR